VRLLSSVAYNSNCDSTRLSETTFATGGPPTARRASHSQSALSDNPSGHLLPEGSARSCIVSNAGYKADEKLAQDFRGRDLDAWLLVREQRCSHPQ
jgi:hypothetical protein